MSNGAFRLAAFTPNDETVLVRNPFFHAAGDVKIDREILASIDDRAAGFLRFRAGEIDTYDDAPADDLAFVRQTLKDEFHVAPTLGILYLAFNTKKPPFDDPRVRNALSMAIDREFLAGSIWGGAMAPAYSFVPPGIDNYVNGVAADFRDLSPIEREERARELLNEAGFRAGRPLAVEIRYNTSENNKATAIAVADMWKPLGVTTTFVNTDVKTHFGLLQNGGDFDVARAGWIGDYSDPQNFLFLFESGNSRLNYARWSNPDFDGLMQVAAEETEPGARAQTLAEAERLLLREEPVIPAALLRVEDHGVAAGEGLARQSARPASGALAVDRAGRGGRRHCRPSEALRGPRRLARHGGINPSLRGEAEAIHRPIASHDMDGFVAALLAMTGAGVGASRTKAATPFAPPPPAPPPAYRRKGRRPPNPQTGPGQAGSPATARRHARATAARYCRARRG